VVGNIWYTSVELMADFCDKESVPLMLLLARMFISSLGMFHSRNHDEIVVLSSCLGYIIDVNAGYGHSGRAEVMLPILYRFILDVWRWRWR
jgi:hypothetical protein